LSVERSVAYRPARASCAGIGLLLGAAPLAAQERVAFWSETINLVISDVALPGLRSRSLTRAMRDDSALHDVSMLLLKPFNTHQLSAALDGFVPRRPAPP
jgi:CheY-like chemotaxis protein